MSNDGPFTRDELGQFAPSGTDAQKKQQTAARAKKIQKLHQLQALLAAGQAAGVDAGAQNLIKTQIAALVKSANRPATARRATAGTKTASRVRTPTAVKQKKPKKAKHKKSKKGTSGKKVKSK